MTRVPRLDRLRAGLHGAVEHLRRDAAAEATVRRIARTLSGLDGVEVALKWAAHAVATARGERLLPGAEALLVTLDAAAARERGDDEGFSGPRVLVVEGDPGVAADLTRSLVGGNARIRWLPRGGAVRESVTESPADILVMDLILPDRDGRALLREVKSHPVAGAIPVVAMGLGKNSLDRSEAMALGAAAFMDKPVDPEALLGELRRLLREGASRADGAAARAEAEEAPQETGSGEEVEVRREAGALEVARAATHGVVAQAEDGDFMETGHPPGMSREDFVRAFGEMGRDSGSVALLTLEGFGTLEERVGDQAAQAALMEVVEALQTRMPGARVCLWDAPEIGVLFSGVHRDGAFQELKAVLGALVQDPCQAPGADFLAEGATGGVVAFSGGEAADQVMARADAVRTGMESGGRRIVPADHGEAAAPVILLVEDDPVSARLVEYKLNQVGFQVVHFTNGDDARDALPTTSFDLAIFDLNLPGTDGFQLVQAVRSTAHDIHRPIIILSGLSGEAGIVRALEMGADDYVMKPFSPVELTARVRRLLATARDTR